MTELLMKIPTPAQVRNKISSEEHTASDLFPADVMWRSLFYIDALHQHLKNLARLGVADEKFVRRGITLLVRALSDEARPRQNDVCLRAMRVLTAFLQEKPIVMTSSTLIDSPDQFSSCIYRIFNEALSLSIEYTHMRHAMVSAGFDLLQEASRQQPEVWQSFAKDTRVADLHSRILFESDLTLSISAAKSIKDFCKDTGTPDAVVDFYTTTTLCILPHALRHGDRAKHYFELATSLLLDNTALRNDEARARAVTDRLLSTLWSYSHLESADVPILDVIITELLKLITESVNVLRSFKKPLGLHGLAGRLFGQLLFVRGVGDGIASLEQDPDGNISNEATHQLFHKQSRCALYELIKATCDTKDDVAKLLEAMSEPLQAARDDPNEKYPAQKALLRQPTHCSGLSNLGQTCYMNSLLQQLYANVSFRQFILNTPTPDPEQQKLLQQVKLLFGLMQNSALRSVNTEAIAKELNTDVSSQEDVHDFYAELLSKLEKELPDQAKSDFQKFYTGKMIAQTKGQCGHVSPKEESFVDLQIVVKNKETLADTLDELVQGEPMRGANQFKCQSCDPNGGGKLVDAMRRACPSAIPDNLTFCLKRFEYDNLTNMEVKVNDRFVFPDTINMRKYHVDYLDTPEADDKADMFELVGVIVHQGYNGVGHYWSYTRLRDPATSDLDHWVKLEDQNVTIYPGGFKEVKEECYGGRRTKDGHEVTDNAYVLFYRRRTAPPAQMTVMAAVHDPETQAPLPPRVPFATDYEKMIRRENECAYRTAHLFDEQFSGLLQWLLAKCTRLELVAQDAGSPAELNNADATTEKLTMLISSVASTFIQRIAPCDPTTPVKKLKIGIKGLNDLIKHQTRLASYVLRDLTRADWFRSIIRHNNPNVRRTVNDFVWNLLDITRYDDHAYYDEVLVQLRQAHASYMAEPERIATLDWNAYLHFAVEMASRGSAGAAAVLDDGYWNWVFEMLHLRWDKAIQSKYKGSLDHKVVNAQQMSVLYWFIANMMENYLAVPDASASDPEDGTHLVRDGLALLRRPEYELLYHRYPDSEVLTWIRTARFADTNGGWKECMPGKLLGVLIAQFGASELLCGDIVDHVDTEEEQFSSVLHLALHFCINSTSEADAIRVFRQAAKVAFQWEGCEGELLQIMQPALEHIPHIVLKTLEIWVLHFLMLPKAKMVREATAELLVDHVFGADADLTQPYLAAVRARLAAKLVRDGAQIVRSAYHEEQPKTRYENVIHVYKWVHPWLLSFRQSIDQQRNEGTNVSRELLVEYDRAGQTLRALEDLDSVVEDWESEPGDVVRSREEDSDEYGSDEVSDEDWDSGNDA